MASNSRDVIACDYCHQEVERDDIEEHLNEECEKVDRPREQTADHTPKKLSVTKLSCEEKLKNIQEEFTERILLIEKQFEEQQKKQCVIKKCEETSDHTSKLLSLEDKLKNMQEEFMKIQEQQQANERRLQEQQEESRNNLNRLDNAIKNQLEIHLQRQYHYNNNQKRELWMITSVIMIVVAVHLALIIGLAQEYEISYPSEVCGGLGWRRVAFINMTDPNQDCPQGLNLTDSIRSCGRAHTGSYDCSSVTFPVGGLPYSQVCGRVTAYRQGHNYAFYSYYTAGQNIDGYYVDGLSLTHGSPRTHIWSFASGLFNGTSGDYYQDYCCPCDPGNTYDSPPFVGNDYFCDSVATANNWVGQYRFFFDNALWDGEDLLNTCYGLNNPPWFNKTLPVPTTNDIELRMCFNGDSSVSNVGVELVELYTH